MATAQPIGRQASMKSQPLPLDSLPTSLDIIIHYHHLIEVNCSSGMLKYNTLSATKLKDVTADVAAMLDKSGIPHHLHGRSGEKRILLLMKKYRETNKGKNDKKG